MYIYLSVLPTNYFSQTSTPPSQTNFLLSYFQHCKDNLSSSFTVGTEWQEINAVIQDNISRHYCQKCILKLFVFHLKSCCLTASVWAFIESFRNLGEAFRQFLKFRVLKWHVKFHHTIQGKIATALIYIGSETSCKKKCQHTNRLCKFSPKGPLFALFFCSVTLCLIDHLVSYK